MKFYRTGQQWGHWGEIVSRSRARFSALEKKITFATARKDDREQDPDSETKKKTKIERPASPITRHEVLPNRTAVGSLRWNHQQKQSTLPGPEKKIAMQRKGTGVKNTKQSCTHDCRFCKIGQQRGGWDEISSKIQSKGWLGANHQPKQSMLLAPERKLEKKKIIMNRQGKTSGRNRSAIVSTQVLYFCSSLLREKARFTFCTKVKRHESQSGALSNFLY